MNCKKQKKNAIEGKSESKSPPSEIEGKVSQKSPPSGKKKTQRMKAHK